MNAQTTHHNIKAEWQSSQGSPVIVLTQQNEFSEPDEVRMHPRQMRALCEHFGLMEADPQATKTITTLQRRMLALRDRIDALGDYMTNFSDHKHADLSNELNTVNLLADLADEWCADFEVYPAEVSITSAHPAPAAAQPATPTQAPLL